MYIYTHWVIPVCQMTSQQRPGSQATKTYVQITKVGISHVMSAEWASWKRYTVLMTEMHMVLQEVIVNI